MKFNSDITIHKILVALGIIIILLYYLPYFYYGENAHILIHDNLDSNVGCV